MQKKYTDFKLGVPDYVTVETEKERLVCQGGKTGVTAGATTVEFQDAGEHEDIFITSEDAVRCVKLRWNYKIPKSARFLGDAWERTYGDMEWHGMSGNRYFPWYFLAKLSEKVLCFGVKVRPSAMCFWQADTKGITLFLDVRCGGTGVQLKGRKLRAAQIVCMESEVQIVLKLPGNSVKKCVQIRSSRNFRCMEAITGITLMVTALKRRF